MSQVPTKCRHGRTANTRIEATHRQLLPPYALTRCLPPGDALWPPCCLPNSFQAKVNIGVEGRSVAFSPNGAHLAVGTTNGMVKVLTVENLTVKVGAPATSRHATYCYCCLWRSHSQVAAGAACHRHLCSA